MIGLVDGSSAPFHRRVHLHILAEAQRIESVQRHLAGRPQGCGPRAGGQEKGANDNVGV